MRKVQKVAETIDEYIASFPGDVRKRLERIRMTIRKAAPKASEKISYQMPAFTLNGGYLVYFAAYNTHIGLYPAPAGRERFNNALSAYRAGKSTVRFPLDKPIPLELVTQIVKLRVKDNLSKAKTKARKTPKLRATR
jgi:uncharacterized protein YdhG (YjbR/CyaY superfamily)